MSEALPPPVPGTPSAGAPGSGDRYIVCGAGTTGRVAAQELLSTGRRVTVVEKDPEACAVMGEVIPPEQVLEGDATDEEVLLQAGAKSATALVATLREDKLNLVVTVTALQINPSIRVICRSNDEAQWPRLRRAGAVVVSPAHIGGRRLATGMIHPHSTSFLNEMLTAPSEKPIRFEAVVVEKGSEGDGRSFGELDTFGRTGLKIVASCRGPGGDFLCNPPLDYRLAPGDRLIVIGDHPSIDRLAAIVGRWE